MNDESIVLLIWLGIICLFIIFGFVREAKYSIQKLKHAKIGEIYWDNQWGERRIKIVNVNYSNPRKLKVVYLRRDNSYIIGEEKDMSLKHLRENYISQEERNTLIQNMKS